MMAEKIFIDAEQGMSESGVASISWERDWDAAADRARRERRLLLVDVEKDH